MAVVDSFSPIPVFLAIFFAASTPSPPAFKVVVANLSNKKACMPFFILSKYLSSAETILSSGLSGVAIKSETVLVASTNFSTPTPVFNLKAVSTGVDFKYSTILLTISLLKPSENKLKALSSYGSVKAKSTIPAAAIP